MVEWISHRGVRDASSGECSENSYKAFVLARDAGFSWLETDVRCAADGKLLLSHDSDLRRCFATNLVVETTTSSELRALTGPFGDKLLFFDEFAEAFTDVNWVLDIKPESALRVVQAFSEEPYRALLKSRIRRIKFLFWDVTPQMQLVASFPDVECLARQDECWRAGLATLVHLPQFGRLESGKTYSLPPNFCGIDLYKPHILKQYHHNGAKILAYLPETRLQAERAIAAGADFVLANSALFSM